MKFPRQHKIYTGHLDLGSVAGLFFLLLIFVLLNSSLVFRPGLRVGLRSEEFSRNIIRLSENDQVTFQDRTALFPEFAARMRSQMARTNAIRIFQVELGPNVTDDQRRAMQELGRELNLSLHYTKPGIELPAVNGLPGTTNPVVVVAVTHNGQIYFEDQITRMERLSTQLGRARTKIKGPLTLVIEADKDVDYSSIYRIMLLAREAGINEALLGARAASAANGMF